MRLQSIADTLGLVLHGNPDAPINGLAPVRSAGRKELSFVVSSRYLPALKATNAGAVIVPEALAPDAPCSYLVSDNPYHSYAKASQLLYPDAEVQASVDSSASIASDAVLEERVSIGAHAVIESGVRIGADTSIGPGCYIGPGVTIGKRCRIHANITIYHDCELGDDCRIQSGAVLGADGFGFARDQQGWTRIQQVGRVVAGNNVEIGANTTIDRGALDDTIIGNGVILDNQIQIAHNVRIGDHTAIAACVGIAGSTTIGANCTIGGKVAIVGHLCIADNVHLTATSFVTQSINQAGSYSSGMPLQPTQQWRRTYARLTKLNDLFRLLKKPGVS